MKQCFRRYTGGDMTYRDNELSLSQKEKIGFSFLFFNLTQTQR